MLVKSVFFSTISHIFDGWTALQVNYAAMIKYLFDSSPMKLKKFSNCSLVGRRVKLRVQTSK